jgi:hypothetical protein
MRFGFHGRAFASREQCRFSVRAMVVSYQVLRAVRLPHYNDAVSDSVQPDYRPKQCDIVSCLLKHRQTHAERNSERTSSYAVSRILE